MYGENRGGFRPRGGMGGGFTPVQVGEEVDVRIEAVGEKGDGIARKKGFVLFVPNTKEGDEVRIKVTKVLRKVGFAEVVGQAQGPIEEDAGPAPRQERREDRYEEPAPMPEPEPSPEDSEDFGEELLEPEEQDEPAEEAAPEEPSEEPAEPEAPQDDLEVPPPPEGEEEEKKEESM